MPVRSPVVMVNLRLQQNALELVQVDAVQGGSGVNQANKHTYILKGEIKIEIARLAADDAAPPYTCEPDFQDKKSKPCRPSGWSVPARRKSGTQASILAHQSNGVTRLVVRCGAAWISPQLEAGGRRCRWLLNFNCDAKS